jgi:hypothetical protein
MLGNTADGKHADGKRRDGTAASITVPLIGTLFSFAAACLAAYVAYYATVKTGEIAQQTDSIQRQIISIQQAQHDADQAAKSAEFNRDTARQYISILYADIISKDTARQRVALSLVALMEPETGLKLIRWAQNSGVILAENKKQGQDVEKQLIEDSNRFLVYVHLGQSGNRPIPNREVVISTLSSGGYRLGATDDLSDKYGPGVDYFHDQDKAGAERVAEAMKGLLPAGSKEIHARLQNGPGRDGVLGIWF